jgi:hypothetical protein
MRRRCFRIYRYPHYGPYEVWHWECTLCQPPAKGARYGPGAWARIVAISLPHHFRARRCHHQWVRRRYGSTG